MMSRISSRVAWAVPLALAALAAPARRGHAQQSGQAGLRPASSGVYTDEQAERGAELYSAACVGCHASSSHRGDPFRSAWGGKRVSELFSFMSTRMPKNDPGSLAPEEYAQLVAYLLRLNGLPPGTESLPADSVALGSIRIDVSSHPGKR